jgi:hypothetical protein
MTDVVPGVALAEAPSTGQRLFLRYFTAILVDLVVLNFLAEYWETVELDSFTISLFAAVLLQVLLKLTLMIEHRIAAYFKTKEGAPAKILRFLLAWLVLFGSKFVMLAAIEFAFGDWLHFGGPLHGVVAFIGVVVAMLVAEEGIVRFYRRLA